MGIFEKLIEYIQKIDDIYKEKLFINHLNYELVGIIFHKNNNHYLSLAKNGNCTFSSKKIFGFIIMILEDIYKF